VRSWTRLHLSLAGVSACALLLGLVAHEATATIIGPTDDRFELSKVPGLKDIGFGRQDFEQAMACTGAIVCPGKPPHEPGMMGSAASVFSANQIVTAAHIFFDNKTKQRRRNLQSCYFRNYSGRRARFPILVTRAFEEQLRENDPSKNRGRDWAVVRLKSAIPNCKAYDVDPSGEWLSPGVELLAVSHLHKDIMKKFSGREPIGQRCTVRDVVPAPFTDLPFYFTDCDADFGGSGSIELVRRDGKWFAKAIMTHSSNSAVNYGEYSLGKRQFTISLGIAHELLRAIGIEPPRPKPLVPIGAGFPPAVDLDAHDRAGR